MSSRGKKLDKKELDELLKVMGLWIKSYKDPVAKLVMHMRYLESELADARSKLQTNLFSQENRPKVLGQYRVFEKSIEPKNPATFEQRIYAACKVGGYAIEAIQSIKPHLTKDEMFRIANTYAKKEGLNELNDG